MTNTAQLNEHKQQVTYGFNLAAAGYDRAALRHLPNCAKQLVELARLQNGQKVLDIATGTGTAAIAISSKVSSTGQVVGIDLSQDMLAQAQQKIKTAEITNIELRQEDAEKLSFSDNSFDAVICASGIFFVLDVLGGLREWQRVTQPGGIVAFSNFGETAFQPMVEIFYAQVKNYGLQIPSACGLVDTSETCLNLMHRAGFEDIEIQTKQLGYYLDNTNEWWELLWNSGFRIELSQISEEKLEQFKAEHLAEIEKLKTDRGLWLDVETIFVMGKKPNP
ncbi:class I SAM-dependent methyltransferase [Microseira wollei]|uniref:Methyltransferase type 11 n=1 Tax=Microseira wollei NIES-4236 TaxID=2530354 RepID=A0AAV3X790_9CYAN|nr:class I SAM-dependent methyltransferase [Microseira wollei]GET38013.1 methyltransferase type 11 [Microseira wollei NIES-4236]